MATGRACTFCKGTGANPWTQNSTVCPLCDGTGVQYDPGRYMTYEMGPFLLNAPAAAAPTLPQYFVGAQSNTPTLNGVTCQVTGRPFRWMEGLAVSTFPFQVQVKDAGSGAGQSFVPQSLQVHSISLFGTAQRPFPLPTPYVFDKNVQITADFTDLGGAVGTAGVTNGSAVVTLASGGPFLTAAAPGPPYPNNPLWTGATILLGGVAYVILSVQSQNQITLAMNYPGVTNAGIAFAVSNQIRVAFVGAELSA